MDFSTLASALRPTLTPISIPSSSPASWSVASSTVKGRRKIIPSVTSGGGREVIFNLTLSLYGSNGNQTQPLAAAMPYAVDGYVGLAGLAPLLRGGRRPRK